MCQGFTARKLLWSLLHIPHLRCKLNFSKFHHKCWQCYQYLGSGVPPLEFQPDMYTIAPSRCELTCVMRNMFTEQYLDISRGQSN